MCHIEDELDKFNIMAYHDVYIFFFFKVIWNMIPDSECDFKCDLDIGSASFFDTYETVDGGVTIFNASIPKLIKVCKQYF